MNAVVRTQMDLINDAILTYFVNALWHTGVGCFMAEGKVKR